MDSPLVELVQQISRLDWYEAGAFSDVRDLERMTAREAPSPEFLRLLRADRSRLQDVLPTAHRLIGHAADFATLADGTPAGAALLDRVAAFERLTVIDGPLDRLRRRVAAWADDTFRHMVRRWGEPGYEFDECLWPVFEDSCGRDGAAPPDCQFELLILRKLFGSLDLLRLNLVEAIRWLTLHRSIPWAPRPASDDDRNELLKLNAQAEGDAQHGCWLVARCRAARQQDGELRHLAAGFCRWPAIHQRSILKAVKALAPLGQASTGHVSGRAGTATPVLPCSKGRVRNPAIQNRNRRVAEVLKEMGMSTSLKEVMKRLRKEGVGPDLNENVVLNVKKAIRARLRAESGSKR